MGNEFKLNAHKLAQVVPFVAKNDARFYLETVRLLPMPEGALLIATDSHRLVVTHDVAAVVAEPMNIYVPFTAAQLNKGHAVTMRNNRLVLLALSGVELRAGPAGAILEVSEHYRYPDVTRVLPKDFGALKEGLPGAYNRKYLMDFFKLLPVAGFRRGIRFFYDATNPNPEAVSVVARFENDASLVGLLMPVEPNEKCKQVPSWFESYAERYGAKKNDG